MGERFCSLDQTHLGCDSYFSGNHVIPSPKLSEDQKKRKVFTAIWDYIPEVESSRTHFEVLGLGLEGQVLGLGLEASSPRKLACPRLEDSTIF